MVKFRQFINCPTAFSILAVVVFHCSCSHSQVAPESSPAQPPQIARVPPPSRTASAEDLEHQADELRQRKLYGDAFDYYRAALAKNPRSAKLYNKIGVGELMRERLGNAQSAFERAAKLDPRYADAYNNLGVVEYLRKRYGKAVKQYEKAVALEPSAASYYSNLGAAYFSKKDWDKSMEAYSRAVALDPGIFDANSSLGVSGKIPSPEDRAHFSFTVAKLYAKNGLTDRSLEYLRRALEEGYKGMGEVYKDAEFAEVRKDPRFTELIASRPFSIPE